MSYINTTGEMNFKKINNKHLSYEKDNVNSFYPQKKCKCNCHKKQSNITNNSTNSPNFNHVLNSNNSNKNKKVHQYYPIRNKSTNNMQPLYNKDIYTNYYNYKKQDYIKHHPKLE
jgi:hypothetical protein